MPTLVSTLYVLTALPPHPPHTSVMTVAFDHRAAVTALLLGTGYNHSIELITGPLGATSSDVTMPL
jgi:hypothetical protein